MSGSTRSTPMGPGREQVPVRRRRRALVALSGAVALVVGAFLTGPQMPSATAASAAPTLVRADDGARVLSETAVGENLVDLTIDSPALDDEAKVRLLLPEGYESHPDKTWPTLWLLHGCCEAQDYKSWTAFTDATDFLADKGVLVVMPTDGYAGFYTNWSGWRFGGHGNQWEDFHMTELPQILQRGYGAGSKQAIAGISIGGTGALNYAAKNPGRFSLAASYSGMLNTLYPGVPRVVQLILLRGFLNPLGPWGDPFLNRRTWKGSNPSDLLSNLRATKVFVSAGDGDGGEFEDRLALDPLEPYARATSKNFASKARSAGVDVTTDWYGDGTHSWPYWQRELHRTWPMFADALGVPR